MRADLAARFSAGLSAGAAHGFDPERFAIYQNNHFASLLGALRARFGAVERLLGTEYFAAISKLYIEADPPRSPVLLHWGEGFGAFLDSFAPLKPYPYLGDVARLEFARARACHARDLPSPPPEALADPQLCLALHPSATLMISAYPLADIWADQPLSAPQSVLVFRAADFSIVQTVLAPFEAAFLQRLPEAPLLSLCDGLEFDPTALLCDLLGRGALAVR